METSGLKKFAQYAHKYLNEQVAIKLKWARAEDSEPRRQSPKLVEALDRAIRESSEERVIERMAYTWFNRFCALRYLDVHRYQRTAIVSPAEGQSQPEILSEAKAGDINEALVPDAAQREHIFKLLQGQISSRDPQGEAYRLLLLAGCHAWSQSLPFLFQRLEDYSELLLPDDLLSPNSILAQTREAMTPELCGVSEDGEAPKEEGVEVLGWLYQFYNSEKKERIFQQLAKRGKIEPEDIPAATQLFTPHYIVRFLLQNSLGRHWLRHRTNTALAQQMEYYIADPINDEEATKASKDGASENLSPTPLKLNSLEELKVCDPACGSGHMLAYAFDLLYEMYEEEGREASDIPSLILKHNLYGLDIDERATSLASFALVMKAASKLRGSKLRRFLKEAHEPNICLLEKVSFEASDLQDYMAEVGSNLFTHGLKETLHQFTEADNFGSLIVPKVASVEETLAQLQAKNLSANLFLASTHKKVLKALKMAEYLSPRYAVVVANPPYMGGKGMNARLATWAKENYPDSKSDLFAMFMERGLTLAVKNGFSAMITMQSWMFLSSYEKLRTRILEETAIVTMAHLGARAFDSIGGEVVSTTAFVLENVSKPNFKGAFLRLVEGRSESEKAELLLKAIQQSKTSV